MSDDDRWSKIDALIEASSLGTPAAKALRERTPPDVGRAIVKAAEYLGRAERAEAERDRLEQRVLILELQARDRERDVRRTRVEGDRLRAALRAVMAETGTSTLAHHYARDALGEGG